jgi:homoserine dehydrogenase
MSEYSWGLMGYKPENPNNIGMEVVAQIDSAHERLQLEQSPNFILRSSGLMAPDGITPHDWESMSDLDEFPDVVFVALPPAEDGEPATSLIEESLKRGATVITCEKGALANNFERLQKISDNFGRLGINATVGGGSRMMEKSRADLRDPDNIREIHLNPNGTLTFTFSSVGPKSGKPSTPGQAVDKAIKLGFAEPGAQDVISVIRSEAEGDIPKKVAIFMNQSGLLSAGNYIDWQELKFDLTDEEIRTALEEAKIRRFIVSAYPADSDSGPERDILGGFDIVHDNWRIVGGFRNTDRNAILHDLAELTDASNGIVVALGPTSESDGINTITGPGAGPKPTVNTMLDDYIRLVRDKRK